MAASPFHARLPLADLAWLVMPPIKNGFYILVVKEGVPQAFASWALLTGDTDQTMRNRLHTLAPDDWAAGSHPWLVDLVSPFADPQIVLQKAKEVSGFASMTTWVVEKTSARPVDF